jgi:hypothetical protein
VAESLNVQPTKQSRREKTPRRGGRLSANAHSVFVLSKDRKALTPTTPTKARKLLKAGVAVKCWSKFGTFGIQMLVATRTEIPETVIGNDWGSKFDGYSVIVGKENVLNTMLLLPDKKRIVRKLEERRMLRRNRRYHNCRRRPARFDNRLRRNWLAPSQAALVGSRLKVILELCQIYPINLAAIEDVRFNHAKYRCGQHFATVEIGKTRLRKFFEDRNIAVRMYEGWQTEEFRKIYGYRKTRIKSAEKFTAHCSDSLALAVNTTIGQHIEPGPFLVVDDTYRCVRRRLHDTQPAKKGIRSAYSKGTVFGLRKGLLIGLAHGKVGQLCGEYKDKYRYYDSKGNRGLTKKLFWVSSNFLIRKGAAILLSAKADRSSAV